MTFSILVYDKESESFGGASATGNLCVGGWVLRGDSRYGISASQGSEPSTIWGEDVIENLKKGLTATDAVNQMVKSDIGREKRQLSVIDSKGNGYAFSGSKNNAIVSQIIGSNIVLSGNLLSSKDVLLGMQTTFSKARGELSEKLLECLNAGALLGGDRRGLQSASILVLNNKKPPISLRVDHDPNPLDKLSKLLELSRESEYATWMSSLPTRQYPPKPREEP